MMNNSRERPDAYKDQRDRCEDLDRQYHQIGIPAVAAALRYQGERSATEKGKGPPPHPGRRTA